MPRPSRAAGEFESIVGAGTGTDLGRPETHPRPFAPNSWFF